MSKPADPRLWWHLRFNDERDEAYTRVYAVKPKDSWVSPDTEHVVKVIEATPTTTAASEMLAELEFACKYFRASYIVTEDSKNYPEYQMWQGFEALLKRIAPAEGQS